jgi:hypothetical protein
MTSTSAFTDPAAPSGEGVETWTTWGLIVKHKIAALSALVLLILLLVIIVGGLLSSKPVLVSDSTTCTAWGSANQTQQREYALRYVREHGALSNGATDAASVVSAINTGCGEAYVNDVEDNITVLQAIRQQY